MQRDNYYTESIFAQSQLWHKEMIIMQRDNYYTVNYYTENVLHRVSYYTDSRLLSQVNYHIVRQSALIMSSLYRFHQYTESIIT